MWQLLNHLHEARGQTYMFKRNYGGSINQSIETNMSMITQNMDA